MVEDPSGKGGRAGGYRNGDYMILAKLLKYSFPIIWGIYYGNNIMGNNKENQGSVFGN